MCTSDFGPLTEPIPAVCLIGNSDNISADGCPCTSNTECKNNCSTITDTCGGLVGKVVARQPTLTATVSSSFVQLGAAVSDSLVLGNTVRGDSGQVQFRLFAPGADACNSFILFPVYLRNISSTGNGTYNSLSFTPTTGGVYQWTARYSGNAFNLSASTACNSIAQQVNVIDSLFRNGFE